MSRYKLSCFGFVKALLPVLLTLFMSPEGGAQDPDPADLPTASSVESGDPQSDNSEGMDVLVDTGGPREPTEKTLPENPKDLVESKDALRPLTYSAPVVSGDTVFFTLYQLGGDEAALEDRAQQASDKLHRVLATAAPEQAASTLRFEVIGNELQVHLLGLHLLTLNRQDLEASGFEGFDGYQAELSAQILGALERQAVRALWQARASTFFLTFFFLLIGILALGQLSNIFERAEESLLERRERFQSVSLFSETLIRGETVGALLTFGLVIGRAVAYILVVVAMGLAILSQFDASQSALRNLFSRIIEMMVDGLQRFIEAIPTLFLALVLAMALYFALKIANLYLRSLALGRIKVKILPPSRLPVARFWIPLLLLLLFFPFITATLLGFRFSSLEVGVISIGIVCLLGFVPLLASCAVGTFVIWNGVLREGHWLEVGEFHGEVTHVNLFDVSLVPEDGGVIRLPMIYLLLHPLHTRPEVPKFEIQFTLKKVGSLVDTLERVRKLFPTKWNVEVVCQSVNQSEVQVLVLAGKFESQIKTLALQILSDACDTGVIELTSDFVEEIRH